MTSAHAHSGVRWAIRINSGQLLVIVNALRHALSGRILLAMNDTAVRIDAWAAHRGARNQQIPSEQILQRTFFDARTHNGWLAEPIDDATLHRLYEALRMGPTAVNSVPARFVFVKSPEAKQRLLPALSPGNVDKTMSAPVTAIVAYDTQFYDQMPKLFPARPGMRDSLAAMPEAQRDFMLLQNASLQAGYLILAARALGLDTGPMGGFDRDKVDAAFLADTPWKSILLVNLGYGDPAKLFPRNPRLDFDEAARIV
jgi:3-hydroxypropanoate dehydrogenase